MTGRAGEAADGGDGDEPLAQLSVLINHNFVLAISMLAKAIFGHEENPYRAMFDQMLVDKVINSAKGRK